MNLAGVEVGLGADRARERGAPGWEGRGVEEAVFVEDEGVGGLEKIAAGAVAGVVVELEESEEGEGQQGEGAKRHGGGVEVEGDRALVDEARGEVVEGVGLEVLGRALTLGAARGLLLLGGDAEELEAAAVEAEDGGCLLEGRGGEGGGILKGASGREEAARDGLGDQGTRARPEPGMRSWRW